LFWGGKPGRIVEAWRQENKFNQDEKNITQIFLSSSIFMELRRNLLQVGESLHFSTREIRSFLDLVRETALFVEPEVKIKICRDKTDNKFLNLCVQVQADYLITGDKDLLVLEKIDNTKILTANSFLNQVLYKGIA
jgi:hypothetical protein